MSGELKFAVTTAKAAGDVLLKYFGTELTRKIKTGPDDYATEADVRAEALILERLLKEFPDDAIVTEESGAHGAGTSGYTWIVDPLDGTHNFAEGRDNFGVMITRAKVEELELAVVWNPAKKILATGEHGQGAWLDGERVSFEDDLTNAPLSVERDNQEQLQHVGLGVTNLGASANILVTLAGERRGFVSSNGFIWDHAPAALLLAEAGWTVTDFQGRPFRWDGEIVNRYPGVIAAPAELHQKLAAVLHR